MNVDVRLLQLYYGCSKKFDPEHKKNSYAGNNRSFAVSRYTGHIIVSLYTGWTGGPYKQRVRLNVSLNSGDGKNVCRVMRIIRKDRNQYFRKLKFYAKAISSSSRVPVNVDKCK